MIKLGTVTLNENLYLEGIENIKRVSTTVHTHLAGTHSVTTTPLSGGGPLTLRTVHDDGSITGFFTQEQIDNIKTIEYTGTPVVLSYRDRGDFNVIVTGTEFKQLEQRVPIAPTKLYTGSITIYWVV